MLRIPGGLARLGGGDERFPEVAPVVVSLAPFWIDAFEVTNQRFAEFVLATGHVTDAERFGNSVVFLGAEGGGSWQMIQGASWRQPRGPGSDAQVRALHPVVQVSSRDAEAYAAWAGKRLPSEVEWEFAARGGLVDQPYVWGADSPFQAAPRANLWQGSFPLENRLEDGYAETAPVQSFAPNGYGLFDMAGNVWEWVSTDRGSGPLGSSHEPLDESMEPGLLHQIRGGSFLCAENYCQGYRPTARQFKVAEDASNNVGFRCARDDS